MDTRRETRRRSFLCSVTVLMLLHAGCAGEPSDSVEEADVADPTGQEEAIGDDPHLIPVAEARTLATRFLGERQAATSRARELEDLHVERDGDDPLLYVFNFKGGGFAVVSADERRSPVLAYAEDGAFDVTALRDGALPPGVAEWMDHTSQAIRDIRSGRLAPQSDGDAYKLLGSDPDTPSIVLPGEGCQDSYHYSKSLSFPTKWNQGCGYNAAAPLASGGPCDRAWAGCVAVAMAQVMKYYQFPAGFDWANMANGFATTATANLLRAAGDSVDTDYGANGSGAYTADVDDALEGFGYSTSAQYTSYSFWKVDQEIDANRPMVMNGGGHAWVVSGYDEQYVCETGILYQYLNINWGWGGTYDGWYRPYDLTPGSSDFGDNNNLVIGITP